MSDTLQDYYLRSARRWAWPAIIGITFFCPVFVLAGGAIFGITDKSPAWYKTYTTVAPLAFLLSALVLALGLRRDDLRLLRLGAPIAPCFIVPLGVVADLATGASSHVYGTLMVALSLVIINNRPLIWLNVVVVLAEVWVVTLLIHPQVTGSLLLETAAMLFLGAIAGQIRASLDSTLRREVALRQSAQSAAQKRSTMIETVAHDLRTPLHHIVNLAKLLHSGWYAGGTPAREDQFELLERIESSSGTLAHQIEQLLQAAQSDSDTPALSQIVAADIEAAAEALRGLLLEKNIRFATWVNLKTPIRSDLVKLRSVVENLVGNAVKFTSAGGQVSFICETCKEGGFYLEVADTGKGIPAEKIPQLFQPYRQVEADVRGVGLGLYIVKKNAALLDGQIDVKSEVGVGTTIRVTFKGAAG